MTKSDYPHHSKATRKIAIRCASQNKRLVNNCCEFGCENGSPNCAVHIQKNECSACKLEEK